MSSLENKVLSILTEKGYVSKGETVASTEITPELLEEEEEDEEVVVDGEVDEGDVHIKPVSRMPIPLVSFGLLIYNFSLSFFISSSYVDSLILFYLEFLIFV